MFCAASVVMILVVLMLVVFAVTGTRPSSGSSGRRGSGRDDCSTCGDPLTPRQSAGAGRIGYAMSVPHPDSSLLSS